MCAVSMHLACVRTSPDRSFGVIMWELATRKRPFEDAEFGPNGRQLRRSIIDGLRLSLDAVLPANRHAAYMAAMARCWDADPRLRPPFGELYSILNDLPRSSSV